MAFHAVLLVSLESSSMNRGAPTLFETIWNYGGKPLIIEPFFSTKNK
jgi:hypothetical protein